MKSKFLFTAALLLCQLLNAQTMRYFEAYHRTQIETGSDWRDSVFVVAASDPALIADIEFELSRPMEERRHLNGPIAGGNGGFNRNANYWFSWHPIPNQWQFAEVSIEACDGRTYSDVEADTAYWIGNLGQYCGWAYCVIREINTPVSAPEPSFPLADFLPVIPNPANEEARFSWVMIADADVMLHVTDALGTLSVTLPLGHKSAGQHDKNFATTALSCGLYFATLRIGREVLVQSFVVAH